MTDDKWHGWRTPEGTLRICSLQNRKQIALCIDETPGPGELRAVAYFRSEEEALETMRLLDLLEDFVEQLEKQAGNE